MMQSYFLAPAVLAVLIGGCTSVPPGGSARDAQGVTPPATAASAPIQLKTMSLDEFMPGRLSVSVSVPVVAPAAWELASLPKAPAFSAYWMKPQDVEVANRTQDLPADNGYMYGNISDSVGYDRRRDVFIGADDPRTLAMLQTNLGVFSTVVMERFTHGQYPVLLMTTTAAGSGKLAYFMYIGVNIDTNVVMVALRPPANSRKIGDYMWGALRKLLVRSALPTREFPARAS